MAANTHRTLYNDIFFHGIVQCVLAVSLHNSETARKHVSVNLGIGALFSTVQFSCVRIFVTPWTTAHQASLSITNSRSLLKLVSIESVMPSNDHILCCPLHLLPSVFPSIRVFSDELVLCIRWPKYWSFSFSISPSNEDSFRMDWFDLLAIQGTLKRLLQHHSSKASILGAQLSLWSNSHIQP